MHFGKAPLLIFLMPSLTANDSPYLFVYGTLRLGHVGAMAALLRREAEPLGSGWMQARLYDLGSYPAAVLSANPRDQVHGDIYLPRDRAVLFAALDGYEECSPQHPPPHEYRRLLVPVAMADGDGLLAWAYLYNLPPHGLPRITRGDYLRHLGLAAAPSQPAATGDYGQPHP